MLLRALSHLFGRGRRSPASIPEPSFATAYRLYQDKRLDDAERACRNLHAVASADVHYLLGLIARERRNHASAAAEFELAVSARDGEPSFHYSLAEALIELGRLGDALRPAERFLALAASGDPRRPRAWMMLFGCKMHAGDGKGAGECAAAAIALAAHDPPALLGIADSYFVEAQIDAARATVQRSVELTGSFAGRIRRAAMLPQVYESRTAIASIRDRFSADLDELLSQPATPTPSPQTEIGILPFYLAYHNQNNVELLRKFCAVARRGFQPLRTQPAPRRASSEIRVGFVSTFFYSHSVGRTTLGLIRDLPRPRFRVHVFAVEPTPDAMAAAIESAADHYHRLGNDIKVIADAIADAELDALVFADIGMHPTTYFLALNRLAPLQLATWGHSETSGIDTIDYYLSAEGVECDTAQAHYSEELLRPKAFFLPGYERPKFSPTAAVESLGLPSGVRRYACLQPEFKLHPDMDEVLRAILELDAEGEIVLLTTRASWTALLKLRLQRALGESVRRVRFVPKMSHDRFLAMLSACDVCLDPLYFGGCNSSCEAMALGKPLVTLPGNFLHGRFTAALYEEMDIRECIAGSVNDYVERALDIARDRDRQQEIATEILLKSDVLFGRRDITVALAQFLEEKVAQTN